MRLRMVPQPFLIDNTRYSLKQNLTFFIKNRNVKTATEQLKAAITEQLKTQEIVRIPGSEEEFFAVAEEISFKIEYHNNEIVTIGLGATLHEMLITNLIVIFGSIFYQTRYFEFSAAT